MRAEGRQKDVVDNRTINEWNKLHADSKNTPKSGFYKFLLALRNKEIYLEGRLVYPYQLWHGYNITHLDQIISSDKGFSIKHINPFSDL